MKISEFENQYGVNLGEDVEASIDGVQYYRAADGTRIMITAGGILATVASVPPETVILEDD